jgi:hypothetical protein
VPECEPDGFAWLAGELEQQPVSGLEPLVAALRERFGGALAALLVYGSCLRRGSTEGVVDFYALVDGYHAAGASRALAVANALLPPSVHYVAAGALRAKVAVYSLAAFERAARGAPLHSVVWARFSQRCALAFARDPAARAATLRSVEACVCALARLGLACAPAAGGRLRLEPEDLFAAALRETFAVEWRVEGAGRPEELAGVDRARWRRAARAALARLAAEGDLRWSPDGDALAVEIDPALRRRWRARWRRLRPIAKAVSLARLVKSAATFGDWVPYALWKLERHTGIRLELTPAQRRHPWLCGWPLLLRLIRKGVLR